MAMSHCGDVLPEVIHSSEGDSMIGWICKTYFCRKLTREAI